MHLERMILSRLASGPRQVCTVLTVLLFLAASVHAQIGATSDNCSNAPAIVPTPQFGIRISGSTTTATVDGSCSCAAASPDVWCTFTPAIDGGFRAFTVTQQFDWVISIHTGCPGTAANEIACNDDSPYSTSGEALVEVELVAGQTYWIRIAGGHGTTGQFMMAADFPTEAWPLHDDPSRPVAIGPGLHHGDGAQAGVFDPLTCVGGGRALWYRYRPAHGGTVTVDTCTYSSAPNGLADTFLDVYSGITPVACSDDYCMYLSQVTFTGVAGRTYLIRASDFWGAGGDFNLRVQGPPAAENVCSALPELVEGMQLVSLVDALANGASACDSGTEPDLAYQFVAPTDGTLLVTTCGTNDGPGIDQGEDTLVSIHSACPPTAANTLACNDNAALPCDGGMPADAAVEVPLAAGQRVVVRITHAGPQISDQPVVVTATFRPGMTSCAGDGSGTACPCGNFGASGHGCAHSFGAGARLSASGVPSVSADTLRLEGSELPPSASALYIQGTALVGGGAGAAFGDGLRCVGGSVIRLGVRVSANGVSAFGHGDGTGSSIAMKGLVPAAGGTRHYQLWFRDVAPFCTSALFNLSNALSVMWVL